MQFGSISSIFGPNVLFLGARRGRLANFQKAAAIAGRHRRARR